MAALISPKASEVTLLSTSASTSSAGDRHNRRPHVERGDGLACRAGVGQGSRFLPRHLSRFIDRGRSPLEIEGWILLQDRLLRVAQRASGLDAEPVDERPASVLIGVECLCLSARAVEREHQLGAESLPERMPSDEGLELGRQRGVSTECEVGVDAILEHPEAALLESGDLGLREFRVREVCESRTAPERKCLPKEPRSGFRLTRFQLEPPGVRKPVELLDVEFPRPERKTVAAGRRLHLPVPECLTQSRHVYLQRLEGVARRTARVEIVHDPIGGYGRAPVDEQDGEQRLLFRAEGDLMAVALDLEGAEDPDLHRR